MKNQRNKKREIIFVFVKLHAQCKKEGMKI
jgi:hypothetical protein